MKKKEERKFSILTKDEMRKVKGGSIPPEPPIVINPDGTIDVPNPPTTIENIMDLIICH